MPCAAGPDADALATTDPATAAAEAGLRYVSDEQPGIRRRRCGRGFTYLAPDGSTVRDRALRRRIEELAIPPAWTGVWICPSPRGHLQATGRDAEGRKQYLYHPRWREVRDATKFDRLIPFGHALPEIRRGVAEDLSRRGLPRRKVLATVVRLLETTCIRIGNETYRRRNGSYGLTTLRSRHVAISGSKLRFRFRAKGGAECEVAVTDRRLAGVLRRCLELPGYELFQYLDDEGRRTAVDSGDVNDYLHSLAGERFTAKDFRTWMGSVHALDALCELGPAESTKEAEKNVLAAVDHTAEQLRNTRAVCRSSYIHPGVIEAYADGRLFDELGPDYPPPDGEWLDGEEVALLTLLETLRRQPAAV